LDIRAIDVSILIFINKTLRVDALDPIMVFITNKGYILAFFVVLGLIFKDKKSALIAASLGIASVLLTDWISHIVKHIVERQRPFYEFPEINFLTGRGRSFSMPSNHASNAFAFIAQSMVRSLRNVSGGFKAASATPLPSGSSVTIASRTSSGDSRSISRIWIRIGRGVLRTSSL
jgi:membrane-associated phospholipid phosphatase